MADEDCSATGAVCETNGYCSFVDTNCVGGRRYGDLSGAQAGMCVGASGFDGGVDVRPDSAGCPSGYSQLGLSAHRYRTISTLAAWPAQKAACAADGANVYLVVPTDQTELSALAATAGAARFWVGIDDQTTEGMYVTTRGGTLLANDPMWDQAAGEPNDAPSTGSGGADCVSGLMSNGKLSDDGCTKTFPAICECEP